MTKANIEITGGFVRNNITEAIKNFQRDEYSVDYAFGESTVFMFEQYKRSITNHVLNIVLDFEMNRNEHEFTVQCIAMGERDRTSISFLSYEKSIIKDLSAHLFNYAKKNELHWQISEIQFIKK